MVEEGKLISRMIAEEIYEAKWREGEWRMSDRSISWLRSKDSGSNEGRRYSSKISVACGLRTWLMESPPRKVIPNYPSNKNEGGKFGGFGGGWEGSTMTKSDEKQGVVWGESKQWMRGRWSEVVSDNVDGKLVSDRVVNWLYDGELKSSTKQKEGLCSDKIGVGWW